MDDIGLYKGKLNEALNIVPSMSQEKKWEAVTYWNDVAMQFQQIVATTDGATTTSSTSSNIVRDKTNPITDCNQNLNENSIITNEENELLETQQQHCSLVDNQQISSPIVPLIDNQAASILEYVESDTATVVVAPGATVTTTPPSPSLQSPLISSSTATTSTPSATTSIQDKVVASKLTTTDVGRHLVDSQIPLEATVEYDNLILSDSLGCTRTTADVADEIGNGQFDRGPTLEAGGAVLPANTNATYVVTTSTTSSNLAAPIIQHTIFPSETIANSNISTNDAECVNTTTTTTTTTTTNNTGNNTTCPSSTPAIMIPMVYPSHRNHVDSYTHTDRPLQPIQQFEPSIVDNHHHHNNHHHHQHELFFHTNHSDNQNHHRMRNVCYNDGNSYMADNHHHHNHNHSSLHYSTSPIDNNNTTAFGNMFSPSDTSSPIENCSSLDMEQIVGIKRELIVDSERDDTTVSNGSTNSNSANSLESTGIGANNQQQHTCDVCGKSGFSTKGNLKRHLKAHSGEKPFKCDYCESCFTEKKSLKIHVRRHTGEKPYKCHVCGKLFSQTGVLQSHMALHLNERKFECQKCGKAFRQRSQLKLHLMRHDGVKRLECQTCNAKFLTKGDLERHCRIHTGERPYKCDLCDKTFTRQQSLNEHINRHTGKKPYYCKFCDKTFSEMSACYKHAKTHKRQEQLQQQQQQQQQQLQLQQQAVISNLIT